MDARERAAGAGQHFAGRCEEWRQAMGLSHTEFAAFLGRRKAEWSNYRSGRRSVPLSFVRVVRAKAYEYGGPWPQLLDDAYAADAFAQLAEPA